MTPSISQDGVNVALGNFLKAALGLADGKIVVGQSNRVASPEGDFVVFWPLRRPRLATNLDTSADGAFTGSIAPINANTATMTITAVDPDFTGQLKVGSKVFGVGVAADTTVTALGTGSGGIGTYVVTPSQTVASGTLSAGTVDIAQSTDVVMQIDVHGPNSGDNVQTISTLFRDQYAVDRFAGTGVSPLYAEDPRQMPFSTAAHQFEDRWMIDVHMQITPAVSVPQQFADTLELDLVDVETPAASWPNSTITVP
ncbi:hypothetical protein LJR220_003335 [Bradyrhizobium sp. LjRoot220]|uniref:phage neck terminator protein n=1 Tax=Bradyrhizobium sp. LjRoot220 TaxID=3342284 RepID=UPI003ED0D617